MLFGETLSLQDSTEEFRAMELQHVNVKLFLADAGEMKLDALIPIFHEWIERQVFDELLLDVADYRHVPAGPGIVLIGYQADYAVDNTDGRWGVRYNRKTLLAGGNQDRFTQGTRAVLSALIRLQEEPRLDGKLRIGGDEIEISINDRLLAPNNEETREAVEPELKAFFSKLFGESVALSSPKDSRRLFSVTAKSPRQLSAAQLLTNLRS